MIGCVRDRGERELRVREGKRERGKEREGRERGGGRRNVVLTFQQVYFATQARRLNQIDLRTLGAS